MIEVQIGEIKRRENEADESWVNQQINKRRFDNQTVCVRVFIKEGNLDFILSSPECPSIGRPKTTPLTKQEQVILNLWEKFKLDTNDFSGGNLISFIKQVHNYI